METLELVRVLQLGEILRDLDDTQICIDALREGDAGNQAVQLDLDRKQAELDIRRKVVVRKFGEIISLN